MISSGFSVSEEEIARMQEDPLLSAYRYGELRVGNVLPSGGIIRGSWMHKLSSEILLLVEKDGELWKVFPD